MTLVAADALAFVARFFVAGFFAPRPFDVVDGRFADRALGVLAIPIILPKRQYRTGDALSQITVQRK